MLFVKCNESYQKILEFEKICKKKFTFFLSVQMDIFKHIFQEKKTLYIHQIITGCYGNGNGTKI